MLGLRANTVLFVGLLLGPALLLAWLGFAATAPLERELLRAARDEVLRVGSAAGVELPARIAARLQRHGAVVQDIARELAVTLPEQGAAAFAAAEQRTPGLVLRARSGRVLLPAPPRDLAMPHLAEWATFRRVLADDRADEAAAQALVAGPLRARALVHVLAGRPDAAAAALATCRDDDLVAGGPRVVAVLLASAAGRERLRRAPWVLLAAPALESERLAWLEGAAVAGLVPGQRLRARAELGDGCEVAAPLPGGASLVRLVDVAAELSALASTDGACAVAFHRVGAAEAAADDQAAPRFVASVATPIGPVRVTAVHRQVGALAAAARQRRWLTGAGVLLLVGVMGFGVVLVRRALAQEATARALRDRFLANVSHDLKTPLTSLRLHAEMLGDERLPAAARRRYAAVVLAEGARMSALVEDLLDVSALQQGRRRIEPEPVDLAAAVRSQAEAWRPLLERDGVALRLRADGEVPALADPIALGRILTNLLQNAARHGRPARDGGASWVELAAGPGPRLHVRDNGPGVPPALRERIFERFERAGAQGDGLGLGLALARELATACGGSLRCGDDGSTLFELVLPELPPEPPT